MHACGHALSSRLYAGGNVHFLSYACKGHCKGKQWFSKCKGPWQSFLANVCLSMADDCGLLA